MLALAWPYWHWPGLTSAGLALLALAWPYWRWPSAILALKAGYRHH